MSVDPARIRVLQDAPLTQRSGGVLYWMTSARRTSYNPGLEHAVAVAKRLSAPLLVVEPLRLRYRYACPRFHRFVIQGMRDNARSFNEAGVSYYPYVEREVGQARGMFREFCKQASVVVLDDYPAFHYPALERALLRSCREMPLQVLSVDSNGILPMRGTERRFHRAVDFRRHMQRSIEGALDCFPAELPLAGGVKRARISAALRRRFAPLTAPQLAAPDTWVDALPLRGATCAVKTEGGSAQAEQRLDDFLDNRLSRYAERNHPDSSVQSQLSPYLHFGHISAHRVFSQLAQGEEWERDLLASTRRGQREGFWGMSAGAEGFVDQLITWRELGFNRCVHDPLLHTQYAGLPAWARATLSAHASDPRPYCYSLEQLESAETHDEIWNAAQRQLVTEGTIHNYLRMLWGKKMLEWSSAPEQGFEWVTHLNDKYALDGQDPNSYSGISWIFGCFDRAFGPERAIFGKVRYMSSDNTRRKLRLKAYLQRYGGDEQPGETLSMFS